MSAIPIVVLAGSLGAGKTTLLRSLLQQHEGTCHVVVNEIGKVLPGIGDFKVIAESTTVLGGGCACCKRREDLIEDLIAFANDAGNADGAKVFLELSGIADPAPVVRTLLEHPFLVHHYALQKVITVVDVLDASNPDNRDDLWNNQVVLADECLYSKTDLVSPTTLNEVDRLIREINPWAVRALSDHGKVTTHQTATPAAQLSGEKISCTSAQRSNLAAHGDAPDVTLLSVGETFEWVGFGVWLSLLLHRWGSQVLRVKGVVPIGNGAGLSVNAVHHAVFAPEHVEDFPADGGQLAFITQGMPVDLFERSLATFASLVR